MTGMAEDPELRALLRLRSLPGVGDATVAALVKTFGSAVAALSAPRDGFASVAGGEAAGAREGEGWDSGIDRILQRADEMGARVVGLGMPGYPQVLEALHDPPPVLFLRGHPEVLGRPTVAVVGSRRATVYGRRSAEILGATLAREGIVVASGLALGIDAAAHRGALQADGELVGVLGSGIDVPSPRANVGLFRQIARDHLLVSEFPPGTPAAPHHFPQRNRIMAALSSAVIVVEAAARSGAIITVNHALDLGREILAVPGKVDSPTSRGTNALIRDGATIICDLERVREVLAMELPAVFGETETTRSYDGRSGGGQGEVDGDESRPPPGLSGEAARVWEALGAGASRVDELARVADLSSGRVLAVLSGLEASGWAELRPGMRYVRRARRDSARRTGGSPQARLDLG